MRCSFRSRSNSAESTFCYSDRDVQLDFSKGASQDQIGYFLLDVLEGFNSSAELNRLVKRIREGTRAWVLRGFYPATSCPWGLARWYADEHTGAFLAPVDEGAVVRRKGQRFRLRTRDDETPGIIAEIFDSVIRGKSMAGIANGLNERGVLSPSGGVWNAQAVNRLVRNPLYAGTLIWGRTRGGADVKPANEAEVTGFEAIRMDGFLEAPIVTQEQFQAVAEILEGNRDTLRRRRRSSPDFALSGLIVCGACGGRYHGHGASPVLALSTGSGADTTGTVARPPTIRVRVRGRGI